MNLNRVDWYLVSTNDETGFDNRIVKDARDADAAAAVMLAEAPLATRVEILDVANGYDVVRVVAR